MQTYQLYKSFTTSTNAGAQLQIIKAGRILGVQWAVAQGVDSGSGEGFILEVSLVPIFQSTTNDARGVVSVVTSELNMVTSGMAMSGLNLFFPVDVPVGAGQLLYLNYLTVGTPPNATRATCLIQVR